MKSLFIWSCVCLAAMLLGPIGTGIMPKSVFGLFERFSTFSAVIFNAVLGTFLLLGKFGEDFEINSILQVDCLELEMVL